MTLPVPPAILDATRSLLGGAIGSLVERGVSISDQALSRSLQSWRFTNYATNAWVEGGIFPTLDALLRMNRKVGESMTAVARGEQGWRGFLHELSDRMHAGARYQHLVEELGRQVFATARWPDEDVLAEDEFFRLTFLRPPEGVERQPLAVFHVGGAIPFGDGIFRLTQDYNLYDRFLERGLPVYAMELKGDRHANPYGRLTMASLGESTSRLTDVAFEHNDRRRMVMEGYCGHGTQALAWLAANPAQVQRKLCALATFVSPIDGTRCLRIAQSTQVAPEGVTEANLKLSERFGGGFVSGDSARINLDLALGSVFHKTPIGYFSVGFLGDGVGQARTLDELDAQGRRELAGAYWISPEAGRRWPIPADIARFTTGLFTAGLGRDGELGWRGPDGEELTLRTVAEQTDLRIYGFYGGKDLVVPDSTAHPLFDLFGDRYTHVVHRRAGHISYVLSPRSWRSGPPKGLSPNPPKGLCPNPVDLWLADLSGELDRNTSTEGAS